MKIGSEIWRRLQKLRPRQQENPPPGLVSNVEPTLTCAPPTMCWIEITNRCNLRCSYCVYPFLKRKKQDMSRETFVRAVEQFVTGHLEKGSGIGLHLIGEPLLHPRALEFIKIMNDRGIRTDLYTNGTLLTPEWIDRLAGLDLIRLAISIQSPDAQSYGEARGETAHTWEQYMQIIESVVKRYMELLHNCRPVGIARLDLIYMLTPGFKPNMSGVNSWAQALKIVGRWNGMIGSHLPKAALKPAIIHDADNITRFRLLETDGSELNIGFREAGTWAGHLLQDVDGEFPMTGFCANPFHQLIVLANGDVTLCCEDFNGGLVVGNIWRNTLSELWDGDSARGLRDGFINRQLVHPLCRRCKSVAPPQVLMERPDGAPALERWGDDGPWFVWMSEEFRRIVAIASDCEFLEWQALTICPCSVEAPQLLMVVMTGITAMAFELTAPNRWFSFRLPIAENYRGSFVELIISTDRTISPHQAWGSDDRRCLGAALSFKDFEHLQR